MTKNKAAQEMVRLRNKKLTPERRSEIATNASHARKSFKRKAKQKLSTISI